MLADQGPVAAPRPGVAGVVERHENQGCQGDEREGQGENFHGVEVGRKGTRERVPVQLTLSVRSRKKRSARPEKRSCMVSSTASTRPSHAGVSEERRTLSC